jgi:hypothetical protein
MRLHPHKRRRNYFFLVNDTVINACEEQNKINVTSERNKIILTYDLLE